MGSEYMIAALLIDIWTTSLLIFGGLLVVGFFAVAIFFLRKHIAESQPQIPLQFVAITALGIIAMFAIFGLLFLSVPPAAVENLAGSEKTATAGQSIVGVTGQIVSVLGTIGAGAVGAIAGLLAPRAQQRSTTDSTDTGNRTADTDA
jgi:hypothetical protein